MLSERAQILLKTLVERYIAEGQPVGSRALSKYSGLDLSPASIRNVMADLEELGFIASPHTSAGRIPTPRGYRFFVDTLLTLKPLDSDRDQPARRAASPGKPPAPRDVGIAGACRPHALRRRRHDAAPQRRLPAHRVREALGEAHPADHRHARRRRAEPHPPRGPRLHAVRAHRGGQHPEPELRRSHVRGDTRAAAATS